MYRARDTGLKREVALKALPESFAADPARLARFAREAEMLASLSHPNIASIYGVEEASGSPALVMELVDGETLRTASHAVRFRSRTPCRWRVRSRRRWKRRTSRASFTAI